MEPRIDVLGRPHNGGRKKGTKTGRSIQHKGKRPRPGIRTLSTLEMAQSASRYAYRCLQRYAGVDERKAGYWLGMLLDAARVCLPYERGRRRPEEAIPAGLTLNVAVVPGVSPDASEWSKQWSLENGPVIEQGAPSDPLTMPQPIPTDQPIDNPPQDATQSSTEAP
jgi:hypothetical protein